MKSMEELAKELNAIISSWTLEYGCIVKDSGKATVRCINGREFFSSSVIHDVVEFCRINTLEYLFHLSTDGIIEILITHK